LPEGFVLVGMANSDFSLVDLLEVKVAGVVV
jgi:hypothetical protein